MNHLNIEFSNWADLQSQLASIAPAIDESKCGALMRVNQQPDGSGQLSLALFNDDELVNELQRRGATDKPTTGPVPGPTEPATEKRGRGRPRKTDTEAAPAAPAVQTAEPAANEEKAPAPDAVPAAGSAKEPSTATDGVAPNVPTEDTMLELMSEVYSASGSMELVRSIMKEVGDQTQLSRIPVPLWPVLRQRLEKALAEQKAQAT